MASNMPLGAAAASGDTTGASAAASNGVVPVDDKEDQAHHFHNQTTTIAANTANNTNGRQRATSTSLNHHPAAATTAHNNGLGRSGTVNSAGRPPSSTGNSLAGRSSSPFSQRTSRRGTMSSESWRNVRTLPTWVQSREDDDDDDPIIPYPPRASRRPPERSIHDAQRENLPVTPAYQRGPTNVWRNYVEASSMYPPPTANSEKVDLSRHGDLDSPWLSGNRESGDRLTAAEDQEAFIGKKRRQIWYKRANIMLLNSPLVPLYIRLTIFILSTLALALAGSIFHLSRQHDFTQKPSTVMAIVVDAIALVYLVYVTWDEYSGKPLGLRSPKAKMRLIMLDLLFVVFDSANLSLAFDTLYDTRWSCLNVKTSEDFYTKNIEPQYQVVDPICDRQRALAAFLFLALVAWVATFMISVFRVVERVSSSRT